MRQNAEKVALGGARRLESAVDAAGERLIEIWSFTDASGVDCVELVEHTWGSGLGWFPQKRLTLDTEQLQALRSVLERVPAPRPVPVMPACEEAAEREGRVLFLPFVPAT